MPVFIKIALSKLKFFFNVRYEPEVSCIPLNTYTLCSLKYSFFRLPIFSELNYLRKNFLFFSEIPN